MVLVVVVVLTVYSLSTYYLRIIYVLFSNTFKYRQIPSNSFKYPTVVAEVVLPIFLLLAYYLRTIYVLPSNTAQIPSGTRLTDYSHTL